MNSVGFGKELKRTGGGGGGEGGGLGGLVARVSREVGIKTFCIF